MLLIQSEQNYDIDLTKALKIALIHDIPEVIDWDTPWFEKEKNPQHYAKKELLHAKQIFDELPSPMAEELYSLYVEYEEQSSKEAKFIKALDKLETNLQHMESGPLYRSDEERWEHMLNYPNKALSQLQEPFVDTIWEHIKTELEKLTYT